MIQVFSARIGTPEMNELIRVCNKGWLGQGEENTLFEMELSEYYGSPVLVTSSCTAALYMSFKLLGIKAGDEVIMPTITHISNATTVCMNGGTPVFADVNALTLNITASEIERLKTKRTKAIVVLHYGGRPADISMLNMAAGTTPIVEDNALSLYSTTCGKKCGTFGTFGAISFDAMKLTTMCDGGALIINKEQYLKRAKEIRQYGLTEESGYASTRKKWWEYDISGVSGRFINNDLLAAIGRVQFRNRDNAVARNRAIWEYYQNTLSYKGIETPPESDPVDESSYNFYWIRLNSRDKFAEYMRKKDIYCTFKYYPLHKVRYFKSGVKLKNAEKIARETINIPLHPYLTDMEVEKIVRTIRKY